MKNLKTSLLAAIAITIGFVMLSFTTAPDVAVEKSMNAYGDTVEADTMELVLLGDTVEVDTVAIAFIDGCDSAKKDTTEALIQAFLDEDEADSTSEDEGTEKTDEELIQLLSRAFDSDSTEVDTVAGV